MTLVAVEPADGVDRDELLRRAASLEDASEHPIAAAIAAGARDAGLRARAGRRLRATAQGLGVSGVVDGVEVVAGRRRFLAERSLVARRRRAARATTAHEAAGRTSILVGWDGRVRGAVVVADTVKPTSAGAVAELRRLGLRPMLVTG